MPAAPDSRDSRRNAVLYLVGMSASFVGGSAMILAAGIWVKSLTGSSSLAALVSVCLYAPSLLGPFAGLLVDRLPRKRLLVGVNAATAAVMLLLLPVRTEQQVTMIFVVMTCYGFALVLVDPAEQGLFVSMLSVEERQRVNGLRMSIQEGGKLVAPLAGAGLFSLFGGGFVAALTSVTFVVAALFVWRLRVVEEPSRGERSGGWAKELVAGFVHLRSEHELRVVTGSAAVAMCASGPLVAAQFELVDALGRSPSFYGVITGFVGAGSIAAGMASSRVIRRHGEVPLLVAGLCSGCIAYCLFLTGWLPVVLAAAFVIGFFLPWAVIAQVNLAQRLTPAHLQGRVASASTLLLFAPLPVAQALGAVAVTVTSYRGLYLAVLLVGLANLAVVLVLLRSRSWAQPRPDTADDAFASGRSR